MIFRVVPDSKVHVANMGPTWVLSDPDGPHVGPMNLAIWGNVWWPMTWPAVIPSWIFNIFCLVLNDKIPFISVGKLKFWTCFSEDPTEENNIAEDFPDIVGNLRRRLEVLESEIVPQSPKRYTFQPQGVHANFGRIWTPGWCNFEDV